MEKVKQPFPSLLYIPRYYLYLTFQQYTDEKPLTQITHPSLVHVCPVNLVLYIALRSGFVKATSIDQFDCRGKQETRWSKLMS